MILVTQIGTASRCVSCQATLLPSRREALLVMPVISHSCTSGRAQEYMTLKHVVHEG